MLILFMVTVAIIIMNLLIAMTVNKTEDLIEEAERIMLEKRTRQVSQLNEWEESFSKKFLFFRQAKLMRLLAEENNFKVDKSSESKLQ